MVQPQPSPMVRRVAAAQATLDRFKDKPFRWGTNDCARMVAFHLRQLGYRVKLPPSGSYASVRSARAEMTKAGYDSIGAALDQLGLARIAPAATLPGDVIEWPSEIPDIGALGVQLGNGRTVAWHPDTKGAAVLQVSEWIAAWRVEPL